VTRHQVIPSALPSKATCPLHVPARWRTTASLCPHAIGAVMPGVVIAGNRSSSGHAHAPAYSPGRGAQRPIFTLDCDSGLRTGRLVTAFRTAAPTWVNLRTAYARRGNSAIVTTDLLDSRTDVLLYEHNDSTPVLICQCVYACCFYHRDVLCCASTSEETPDTHHERWRDRPDEARQPSSQVRMVPMPPAHLRWTMSGPPNP